MFLIFSVLLHVRQDGLVSLLNQVGSAKDDKIRSGGSLQKYMEKTTQKRANEDDSGQEIFRDLTNRPETPQFWQLFGSGKWDPG